MFFVGFYVDHGASKREKMIRLTSRSSNTSTDRKLRFPKNDRTVSTTPSMMYSSPEGGKKQMSTMNGIFFGFWAASGMAKNGMKLGLVSLAEICWHILGIC